MPVQRYLPFLAASALLATSFSAAAFGAEHTVVLDGGKAWAVQSSEGLTLLPVPEGQFVLHEAVTTAEGRLAAGVELRGEAGGEHLVLLRSHDGKTNQSAERLPTPKQEHDAVVYGPTLLTDKGALTGMVWIEGFAPNKTHVRAAQWTGSGWSQPISVSDFGPGTQIALDVIPLADGSHLAVWAAFDGEDDEIVWSRHAQGTWSAPRPLTTNQVPDVTPALHPTKHGALVAWSGYDGNDYRIHVARLEGDVWSEPTLLEGKGGSWPAFQDVEGNGAVLTWHQAVPSTWMVAAVGGEEAIDWMAPAPMPTGASPLAARPVASADDAGIRLLWPATQDKAAGVESLTFQETRIQRPGS